MVEETAEQLRERIEELQREKESLEEEVSILNTDGGTDKAVDQAKLEDLQKKLVDTEKKNTDLVREKNIETIRSEYPDVDISLISGNALEEMRDSAKKLQDMVNKAKEKTKSEEEDRVKKEWGGNSPGGAPKQTYGSPKGNGGEKDKEVAEKLLNSEDRTDNVYGAMIKSKTLKRKTV